MNPTLSAVRNMAIHKEYGKLTTDQLRELVQLLPQLAVLRTEVRALLARKPKARASLDEKPIWWAPLYELPYLQHLALLTKAVGIDQIVAEAAATDDPTAYMLKVAKGDLPDGVAPAEGVGLPQLLGLATSLERTLESLVVWGRYLNELVIAAREGDDTSLFRAVRIDPTVLSCPSVAVRISKAVLLADKKFLHSLQSALGGPTAKQAKYLRGVRLAIQALREAGVEAISDKAIRSLFIDKLRIYKDSSLGNSEKALRKHIQASKRKFTT